MDAKHLAEVQQDHTRIDRETLLAKLRVNRAAHKSAHELALEGWQEAYIEALRNAGDLLASTLAEFKSKGRTTPLEEDLYRGTAAVLILPTQPKSHVEEYDRQIARLEMSGDMTQFVSHKDFDRFVLDKWSWTTDFKASQTLYNNG